MTRPACRSVAPAVILLLVLGGCAAPAPREPGAPVRAPAPVVDVPAPAPQAPAAPREPEQLALRHVPDKPAIPARSEAANALLAAATRAGAAGDFERAIAALERGVRLAPRDHLMWQQLAMMHFRAGDADQALAFAERARALDAQAGVAAATDELIRALQRAGAGQPDG